MATAVIALSTGTISTLSNNPVQADGTVLEGTMSTGGLAATTGNTAAKTGELDANQGVAWSAQGFEAINQVIGICAAAWSCAPRAAMDRIVRQIQAMQTASNGVPTGG